MAPSPPDPDDPDWEWDAAPRWEPEAPWEPEPEPTPWSELERLRDRGAWGEPDWEADIPPDGPAPHRPVDPHGAGYGPAYLAAAALLTVLFALGLLTVGLQGRGHWARVVLAVGSALLLLGLTMMALATWLVGGLERP